MIDNLLNSFVLVEIDERCIFIDMKYCTF